MYDYMNDKMSKLEYNMINMESKNGLYKEQAIEYHMSISYRMRSILFEWLMQVCVKYELYSDTFETAIILVDEYIDKDFFRNTITNKNYQLLGITCLWISIKINDEEKNLLTTKQLVKLMSSSQTPSDILGMEYRILKNFNWNVYRKCPSYYVEKISSKFNINELLDKSKIAYDKVFNLIDMSYLDYSIALLSPKIITYAVFKILYGLDYCDDKYSVEITECVNKINKFKSQVLCGKEFKNIYVKNSKHYHQRYYDCKYIYDKQSNMITYRAIIMNDAERKNKKNNKKLRLLEICGQGSYSVVYKGVMINKKANTRKVITIKKYKNDNDNIYGINSVIISEISFLRKCNHPNIISIDKIIYKNNRIRITYDYCEKTLYDILSKRKPLISSEIKKYIYQILLGLEHCHSNHIVHADIKPQNILLKNGEVKICDFNCSKLSYLRYKCPQMVTLWYRPPEILLGSINYKTETDVWSAGCVLAEMYLGKVLFDGCSIEDQIQKIFQKLGTPKENSELRKYPNYKNDYNKYAKTKIQINNECDDLLSKMLEMEPSKRITIKEALKHSYFNDLQK